MSDSVRFTVAAAGDGARLDQALAAGVPGLSRRRARTLIDLGGVFVDRARVKQAGRIVRAGQVIEATLGGAFERAIGAAPPAPELPLPVVFEDDHLIVVDKPPGMVTAPTPESDRGDVLDRLRRRPGAGEVFLVHRIDRPTSGLLVFAKTRDANRVLGQRFVDHDLTRRYVAFVAGRLDTITTIDRPISGQRAVTHLRAVTPRGLATELSLELETGRSHQIRIHLAGLGHPVLGDPQHGGEVARRFRPRPPRLALHAAHLGLRHPITDAPLAWDSPLPADLAAWCRRLEEAP